MGTLRALARRIRPMQPPEVREFGVSPAWRSPGCRAGSSVVSEMDVAAVDPAAQLPEEVRVVVRPERSNPDGAQRPRRCRTAEAAQPQGEPQGQEDHPYSRERKGERQQNEHQRTL
jgi:hypothetical protein